MPLNTSILLIGCGRMGSALLTGWRNAGFNTITIYDPAHTEHIETLSGFFDVIICAIKPQDAASILPRFAAHVNSHTLILSIMAGVSVSMLKGFFANHQHTIIRVMPNTPSLIGKGITAMFSPPPLSLNHKNLTEDLLRPLGDLVWIDDETLMNAVTAVSGSGPAYLFYLTEVLTEAGVKQGLPRELSSQLARQTMIGSAALMDQSPTLTPEALREQVTSKGGTTEAALKILMENKALQELFDKAIQAAATRF